MFRLLKNLTKKEFILIIISTILIILDVALELKIPDYMSNITLIYHLDQEFINKKINEIKENLKIEDISIIKYTYDNNMDSIIEDANTKNLFGDKKLIIVENSTFINESDKLDISPLETYLDNYYIRKKENTGISSVGI